jgi:hypothetical protein
MNWYIKKLCSLAHFYTLTNTWLSAKTCKSMSHLGNHLTERMRHELTTKLSATALQKIFCSATSKDLLTCKTHELPSSVKLNSA